MNITHHPDTVWLVDYACGTLSRGFELIMAAHLAACPQCARELGRAERLGAELMMESLPVTGITRPAPMRESGSPVGTWTQSRPLSGLASGSGNPVDLQTLVAQYLECGIFAHGFARAWCDDCGHDYFVAYSCKGRGVCPRATRGGWCRRQRT